MLISGMRWNIGASKRVGILNQPWLVDRANPFITSDVDFLEGKTVDSLTCTDNKSWDANVIADLFNERDQRSMFNVQLSFEREEDYLYWNNEVSGVYSMRSTYKMLHV